MSSILGISCILFFIGIAFVLSNDKKNINLKAIFIMSVIQVTVTWLLLGTSNGLKVIDGTAQVFTKLLNYAQIGIEFIIGSWISDEHFFHFFAIALLPIIFTSALLSVLTHFKILPYIIKYLGGLLSKITGLPHIESFNAINSIVFGPSEAILAIKSQIGKLNTNRLFIVSTSAMSSITASLITSYIAILPAKFVLMAVVLNMFSALILSSIITPVKAAKGEQEVNINDMVQTRNMFEAITVGAIDGGKTVLFVSAMLIALLGLLSLVNGIFATIFGVDLTTIVGYFFAPIAYFMGVPISDTLAAGSIMGTKILANEFAAIKLLREIINELSPKTIAMLSTYLISFASFSAIGVISGAVQVIDGGKAKEICEFGLKMLAVSTMASIISATLVGLFV